MKRPLRFLFCCLVPGGMLAAAPPNLPPLESLGANSDYRVFLATDVAPEVRQEALRRMFQSARPIVDDPVDPFAGDFRSFVPLGDVVTADMRHFAMLETGQVLAGGTASLDATPGPDTNKD